MRKFTITATDTDTFEVEALSFYVKEGTIVFTGWQDGREVAVAAIPVSGCKQVVSTKAD